MPTLTKAQREADALKARRTEQLAEARRVRAENLSRAHSAEADAELAGRQQRGKKPAAQSPNPIPEPEIVSVIRQLDDGWVSELANAMADELMARLAAVLGGHVEDAAVQVLKSRQKA